MPSWLPCLRLVLVLFAFHSSAACIAVQTRVTGDLLIERDELGPGAHEHYTYEAVESHVMAQIAMACVVTAILYGGACWAYLAAPFDDQERAALDNARIDVQRLGGCAHLLGARVEWAGWKATTRSSGIRTLQGARLSLSEAEALCGGAPRPPSTSPAAKPRATPPSRGPPPPPPPPPAPPPPPPAPVAADPAGAPVEDPADP